MLLSLNQEPLNWLRPLPFSLLIKSNQKLIHFLSSSEYFTTVKESGSVNTYSSFENTLKVERLEKLGIVSFPECFILRGFS